LRALAGWAIHDLGIAVRDLASPLLAGGLLFAAGCFALLVIWRQRGAGAAG
jgi:ABC-2 type transport system permease protein